MPLTLDSLAEEIRPILNDICIVHDAVLARVIGVAEDEDDYYYIGMGLQGRRTYYSAVGHCTSLRPGYPAERYAVLENLFTLNGGERVAELEIAHLKTSADWCGVRVAKTEDPEAQARMLERAKWALLCAYQAVGAALLGGTPGRPSEQDVTDLLDVLSRWETYSEEKILSLLPWPKRWVRRGRNERPERLKGGGAGRGHGPQP